MGFRGIVAEKITGTLRTTEVTEKKLGIISVVPVGISTLGVRTAPKILKTAPTCRACPPPLLDPADFLDQAEASPSENRDQADEENFHGKFDAGACHVGVH